MGVLSTWSRAWRRRRGCGKRPRDIRATLPPLVAPLAAITGVSLETAELLASKFETASRLVEASEADIVDTTLKSGRRVYVAWGT